MIQWTQHINTNKTYLLAVSGGIDSMVMANLFLEAHIQFAIAHCNFSMRGNESDEDEQLVTHWCQENEIVCHIKKFDTQVFASEQKLSIQEAARTLRYAFFNELLQTYHYDHIATAHHQGDNVETVLFHLLRGTGIQGLTGIPEKNQQIIRPLLHTSKQAILDYANSHHIAYRDDSSNRKNNYTRNKIRNVVLPFLEEIFPQSTQQIVQTIERMNEVNLIYKKAIELQRSKLVEQRGNDFYIPILKLKHQHPLPTITYELIKPFGFNFEQALQLIKLMDSQTGSLIKQAPYQIVKNRNFFIINKLQDENNDFILIEQNQSLVSFTDGTIHFNVKDKELELHAIPHTEQLDADLIQYPLILRKWRQGDYLYPLGMLKKKKVSRVLIDAKLSLPEKENVWVLESDKKIVCVLGLKLDHRFRIQPKTNNVLHLHWTKN